MKNLLYHASKVSYRGSHYLVSGFPNEEIYITCLKTKRYGTYISNEKSRGPKFLEEVRIQVKKFAKRNKAIRYGLL